MPHPVFDTEAMLDDLRKNPTTPYKDEPGFATQFDRSPAQLAAWNYGALLPIGAAAAALWYLNRRKKKQPETQPAVKFAAVDWSKLLENIRFHLPKLRVPDTAAGMLAGAGVGGLYDLIRGGEEGPDGKKKSRTAQRMLLGALAGAGLSNLVGDRVRRYVANKVVPFGYRPDTMKYLKPKSWQDFYNAAIKDEQSYDKELMQDVLKGGREPAMMDMRHEIVRRTFGLPLRDQANSWWQKNQDGTLSLNEKSPEYMDRLRYIFGPWRSRGETFRDITLNPDKGFPALNNREGTKPQSPDFLAKEQVVGDQQLLYRKLDDGTYQGQMLDRFDLTPSRPESKFFLNNLGKFLTDSKWRGGQLQEDFGYNSGARGDTNAGYMKTLAGRWAWDNLLADELPWISQKIRTAAPPARIYAEHLGGRASHFRPPTPDAQQLQFLRHDNSPATKPLNYHQLGDWMKWHPYANAEPGAK